MQLFYENAIETLDGNKTITIYMYSLKVLSF